MDIDSARIDALRELERSRQLRRCQALLALRTACRMCAAAGVDPLEVLQPKPRPAA